MPIEDKIYDVAVIGAGAAGSMGCLRGVLNNLDTLCFRGNPRTMKKSRATWVGKVENMPVLFDRPKAVFNSSKDVFKWIRSRDLWKEKLREINDSVVKIEGEHGRFLLQASKGEKFYAQNVLLCTGIMDVQPVVQGDIGAVFPYANEGCIHYCVRCDGHKAKGMETAIIGHKEAAGWIASLLVERYACPQMHILTNGHPFEMPEDSSLKARLECYGITLHEAPIDSFQGNPKTEGLQGIVLEGGEVISCKIAFIALGTIVYNELAKSLGCSVDERGYVLTDQNGETNIPGIFAAGDLRANKKKQIYTAWDTTVDAVDKIDSYVRAARRAERIKECPGDASRDENPGALMG